jgi:hypothetical protein
MTDDSEFSDEDRAAVNQAWRALIEDRAHNGKLHYNMPPVRGMMPRGSFRIPKDVIAQLGGDDLQTGGFIVHQMFGVEDSPDDPTIVHGDAVRIIGGGNINTGRRVLEKFVAMLRRQSRDGDGVVLEHDGLDHADDGHHGWRVAR